MDMGFSIGMGLLPLLIWLFIWLLPFILVGTSDKTSGNEKLAWLLAMFFVSWFAWIFYLLLAPLKEKRSDV